MVSLASLVLLPKLYHLSIFRLPGLLELSKDWLMVESLEHPSSLASSLQASFWNVVYAYMNHMLSD